MMRNRKKEQKRRERSRSLKSKPRRKEKTKWNETFAYVNPLRDVECNGVEE